MPPFHAFRIPLFMLMVWTTGIAKASHPEASAGFRLLRPEQEAILQRNMPVLSWEQVPFPGEGTVLIVQALNMENPLLIPMGTSQEYSSNQSITP
jgi:hypothetical protein